MLRPGTYAAVVAPVMTQWGELACQFGRTKDEKPQVAVCFEILRGPAAGHKITWFGYFSEKTEAHTLKALRTCGFTGDDIDKFADQRPTNEVEIVVQDKPGKDGKTYSEVRWVNAPMSGVVLSAPMRDGDLRKFGASFKAKLKAMPAVKGVEARREAPTEEEQGSVSGDEHSQSSPPDDYGQRDTRIDDSDIPF